jgi:hypothetical protein
MNYPDWAPESLVKLHKLRLEHASAGKMTGTFNPDEYVENLRHDTNFSHYDDATFKRLKESLYRNQMFLPSKEGNQLLERLLTDQRMRDVWLSLDRRKKTDDDARRFWMMCDSCIVGWRGEPKISQNERIAILESIQDSAAKLQSNMHLLKDFNLYSINALIDTETIEWLLETLNANLSDFDNAKAVEYAKFCLSDVTPKLDTVLMDIHSKAEAAKQETVTVKKPNSENAGIHYFVRHLSSYFLDYYGQPLHESVATTTSVVLQIDNIDSDYVRKLVKLLPGS